MDQRVNIQYSIDIEELPQEVSRLLEKSIKILSDLSSGDIKKLSSFDERSLLSIACLEAIEETRQNLAAVDYVLNDVTNIVDSFIKYKTSPQQEDKPPSSDGLPPMPPEFRNPELLPDETTLADLKSRIEDFKVNKGTEATS